MDDKNKKLRRTLSLNDLPVAETKKIRLLSSSSIERHRPPVRAATLYELGQKPEQRIVCGEILLQNKAIPYLLLDTPVKAEKVCETVFENWELDAPQAILSVVFSASPSAELAHRQFVKNFVRGVANAWKTVKDLWIFTNGLDTGLSKSIAEELYAINYTRPGRETFLKTAQSILMGICKKDSLAYSDSFEHPIYGPIELENKEDNLGKGKFNLDPYHSHFFLIKDSTTEQQGFENFVAEFEKVLSEVKKSGASSCRVPVVVILLQGCPASVHYVFKHLQNRLPILVVKGSGGLADLLAFTYSKLNRHETMIDFEYMENLVKPGIFKKITHVFPHLQDNAIARDYLCNDVINCIMCAKQNSYAYFDVLDGVEQNERIEQLPYHILKVLFKSQRKYTTDWSVQMKKDLLLTIQWNCEGIATSEVFMTYPKFKIENSIFKAVLFMPNREAFVFLFLKHGFKVRKFLSGNELLNLFKKSVEEHFFRDVCMRRVLGYQKDEEIPSDFVDVDLNILILKLMGISMNVDSEELDMNCLGIYSNTENKKGDATYAEERAVSLLLVWTLLSNKLELSEVIWCNSALPIFGALTSSMLLYRLMSYTKNVKYKSALKQMSRNFSDLAVDIYNASYNDAPHKALALLEDRCVVWENYSVVEMAILCRNKMFVSHPCCQKWITKQFFGNIHIRELSWGFFKVPEFLKIILSAILIFPMHLWVMFKYPVDQKALSSETADLSSSEARVAKGQCEDDAQQAPVIESFQPAAEKYISPPILQKIEFMWNAPVTKFWVFYIFYVIFLIVFSLTVIWPSCGNLYLDVISCTWIVAITLENVVIYTSCKVHSHTRMFWKFMEIIYSLLFIMFYILARLFYVKFDPYTTKVYLCIALLFYYYRLMYIYLPVSRTLGPLLKMLKHLVFKDFKNFGLLTVMVMICNGIALQVLIYPDWPFNPELFRRSFHRAWISLFLTPSQDITMIHVPCDKWNDFDEYHVASTKNSSFRPAGHYIDFTCPNSGFWPFLFGIQYFSLLKIILYTLLFALFSNTLNNREKDSFLTWQFERYYIVTECIAHTHFPPPLNLIYYAFLGICGICKCFRKTKKSKAEDVGSQKGFSSMLVSSDHQYWKNLTYGYFAKRNNIAQEEGYTKEKNHILAELKESINYQQQTIHKAKAQLSELQTDVSFIRLCIRTNNCWTSDESAKKAFEVHNLSRQSPYPGTKIYRFPVPDKYVPWEVKWVNYQPGTYSAPLSDFPSHCWPLFDELDQVIQSDRHSNTSLLRWNMDYVDAKNIFRGRQSWITDSNQETLIYKLHYGYPQNPMGRTGLRGRGSLFQYGPNHCAFIVITRWKDANQSYLEFVETFKTATNLFSLPGGYVKTENRYDIFWKYFHIPLDSDAWETKDDFVNFFKSLHPSLSDHSGNNVPCNMIHRGYMDDPMNTDQAWKEVELWHVHYPAGTKIDFCFKKSMKWRLIAEDVFSHLPSGEAKLLQTVMRAMKVSAAEL